MHTIYSVVILYNPTSTNINNIKKIYEICHKLIIVDNSDFEVSLEGFEFDKFEYVRNNENMGLAKALNLGINRCLKSGDCTHIALFDQDSIPEKNMFVNLLLGLDGCEDAVVAVSPQIIDIKNELLPNKKESEFVDIVITSGSLYPINAFKKVGLLDETFFIDYIDYEWCLRAKSKQFKILKVYNAILYHSMGDDFVNFLGLKKPLHQNMIRHYYIIRNQLIFISRNYIPLKYRITHFFKLFYRIPAYLLLSEDRVATWKLLKKAFYDFFSNRKEYLKIKF